MKKMKKWIYNPKTLITVGLVLSVFACTKVTILVKLDLPPPPPPSHSNYGSSYKYLANDPEFLMIKKFDGLGFPKNLTKERLRQLLQQFIDKVYLVGFRHLGDPDDAQHGHLLCSPDYQSGMIILYHTQEFSGGGYTFDRSKRSWLQWIDNGKTEDAHKYIRRTYPETPEWNAWKEKFLEANYKTGSVDFEMLNPDFVGVEFLYEFGNPYTFVEVANQLQLTFTRIKCERKPLWTADESNIVEVRVDNKKVCLIINGIMG